MKIEADIDSGKKRVWTENEIISVLERTTDDCFVSEAYIRIVVNVLWHPYRTEKLCSYTFNATRRGGELQMQDVRRTLSGPTYAGGAIVVRACGTTNFRLANSRIAIGKENAEALAKHNENAARLRTAH